MPKPESWAASKHRISSNQSARAGARFGKTRNGNRNNNVDVRHPSYGAMTLTTVPFSLKAIWRKGLTSQFEVRAS
jgi:hypothetical protein